MTKQKYLLTIALGLLLLGTTGCDDKLETFETVGVTTAPTAIPASSISSEALPGQIRLTWTAPAEDAFEYMQIRYNDPLAKEDVCLIVSPGTTEMLIDETRARFGDYTFYFQTFNVNGEGSAVTEIIAQSGAAPATYTEAGRTEVTLTADQLSADDPETREGPISNLINGNLNDFFHMRWNTDNGPTNPMPHYIQIDFNEDHENFAIEWWNRIVSNTDGYPTSAELQVSQDGTEWTTVATLTGLPATSGAHYVGEFCMPGMTFRHFRLNVLTSSDNRNYFHMAEFKFYDVEVEVYDPETVPLD